MRNALIEQNVTSKDVMVRCMSSAGEPMTENVQKFFLDLWGVKIRSHLGMTEMGMIW